MTDISWDNVIICDCTTDYTIIDWDALASNISSYDWLINDTLIVTEVKPEATYINGSRLKEGEVRPDPFWLGFTDICLPILNYVMYIRVFRIMLFGAYSRKYDRVRKFRKRRLF